jgi:ferric-dicitrate binding protein FerR (iron transport regulator)/tetratricopeptide (TPR) repeat protein
MSPCEQVTEDLASIVDGDRDVIARHAEHLTTCDACRDARHEASHIATRLAAAGTDYTAGAGLVDRVMVAIDREPAHAKVAPVSAPVSAPPAADPAPAQRAKPRDRRRWLQAGAAFAAMAAASTVYVAATHHHSTEPAIPATAPGGPIGKLAQITRAAADKADGVSIRVGQAAWHPLHANDSIPAGAELRTDERTRTALDLSDGTHVVLDHLTTLAFAADEPRHLTLSAGRIVADVAHVDLRPASVATPAGTIDVVGTRFEATAAADVTSVQVVRGEVTLRDHNNAHESVRAGEEGLIDHGALSVSPTMGLATEVAWSELAAPTKADDGLAGIGALRAYKPGETRDRDWNLALAKHEVKVRISGPIARTEITEVFRNDSAQQLEGVYQFPLPADAQIDGLSLDVDHGFVDGAFVDKERATKIWKGVIDRARPIQQARPEEIVWVPGPWRDPALLDWKRGGRFELRIFPIPAKGQRTIKLAYTQVVTSRGPWRQYVYPLAHSSDGSTVADSMSVDVEVRGAAQGMVRATNYSLVADPARTNVNAMTFSQGGFVPRGDLVVDYKPDTDAELRAWTFQGGAAVAPDAKLAGTKNVGIDPKVVAEQTLVAGDARPTAVLALQPKLPRWTEAKPRDYTIVIDDSQSMVGERYKRATELASTLVAQLDRRDRFTAMLCDSECKTYGALKTPSASSAAELGAWLKDQSLAGASDLVTSVRTAASAMTDAQREHWVLYIGDGFATTGFRKAADVEHALADSTGTNDTHVTTIGIGSDADETVLAAAARGGGGSFLAWQPGMTAGTTAIAALETTYGATLRDATIELPAGLVDSAPTVLPSLRNGQEVLLSARLANEVSGDVVLKGKVAGQPWEQRYPIKLAAAASAANGFVPRLWASLAIGELERAGKGEDRIKEIALSQAYGVMSRETSLLVLESQAMFDAFGVDRHRPTVTWNGEDSVDEVTATGSEAQAQAVPATATTAPSAMTKKAEKAPAMDIEAGDNFGATGVATPTNTGAEVPMDFGRGGARDRAMPMPVMHGRSMIAMHRVWTRIAAVANYTGVDPALAKEITGSEAALAAAPDSREKHRALVQALSYAGELDRAKQVAARWLERDRLDPQALGYLADLTGRDGERDQSLRTLAGLVDLDPDRVALHLRMVNAYERTGRLAQACGHRIALATLQRTVAAAAGAARCLRMVGRTNDATLVMGELADDTQRGAAERLATVAPIDPRLAGDLVVNATWETPADLDLTLVAPDGTRVSWQGGRSDVMVADATAHDREELAIKTLRRGNYLLEITRGDVARSPVRGTLDITVLGVKKALPFELAGTHAVVGHVNVSLHSHLEATGEIRMVNPK